MSSEEIERLSAVAREAASGSVDLPAALTAAIKAAATGPADPWVVAGVLVAGLAHVVGTIPEERRRDCGLAVVQMVIERVRAVGGG